MIKSFHQAVFRGVIVRMFGKNYRNKLKKKKTKSRQLDKYLAYLDYYSQPKRLKFRPTWLDEGYSTWCAVRLQAWYRMIKVWRRSSYKRYQQHI